MKQLIPKMDKVMYIGDETYICQQNDYDLSEIIREKYPLDCIKVRLYFFCRSLMGIRSVRGRDVYKRQNYVFVN